jgi:hypothetical protein
MKLELLVIAYQHDAVNTFPGLVHTARQAMEAGSTRNRCANPQGRQYRKVRLDHLLSKESALRRKAEEMTPHWNCAGIVPAAMHTMLFQLGIVDPGSTVLNCLGL